MSSFSESIDDDLDTGSGSSSSDSNRAVDRLQEVKKYFVNEGLQFRKVIAQGNHGGAVLFDQWLPVEPEPVSAQAATSDSDNDGGSAPEPLMQRRQVVIKYALDTKDDATSDNDEDLRNEYNWLRRLSGAEHIIRILPEYNYLWRTRSNRNRSDSNAGEEGQEAVLSHPVIVMEYLQNGTLDQLINRFGHINRRIPQRLIWSFALCLLRAVAGIAYPDQFDGRRRREMPERGDLSTIVQGSWKGLNVLIGDVQEGLDDPEHALAPALKVIDFGRGREEDPEADPYWQELKGLSDNLAGVAWVLQDLADAPNARDLYGAGDYRLWRASQSDLFDPYDFTTGASQQVLANEKLDKDLRDLIAMCLAGHRHHMPTLRELLILCRAGRRKPAEDFRHLYAKEDDNQSQGQAQAQGEGENDGDQEWLCETDDAIRETMQRVVFDADFDPERYADLPLDELGVHLTAEYLSTLSIDQ
ncbi:kinase-like protein [Apiospora arundinis]|uniref:Protein kinase domain-containing protein n=1 Tax=Apiospora arundinis TaxID=335852 RepID=A0ABR2J7S5_9PEZI